MGNHEPTTLGKCCSLPIHSCGWCWLHCLRWPRKMSRSILCQIIYLLHVSINPRLIKAFGRGSKNYDHSPFFLVIMNQIHPKHPGKTVAKMQLWRPRQSNIFISIPMKMFKLLSGNVFWTLKIICQWKTIVMLLSWRVFGILMVLASHLCQKWILDQGLHHCSVSIQRVFNASLFVQKYTMC